MEEGWSKGMWTLIFFFGLKEKGECKDSEEGRVKERGDASGEVEGEEEERAWWKERGVEGEGEGGGRKERERGAAGAIRQ